MKKCIFCCPDCLACLVLLAQNSSDASKPWLCRSTMFNIVNLVSTTLYNSLRSSTFCVRRTDHHAEPKILRYFDNHSMCGRCPNACPWHSYSARLPDINTIIVHALIRISQVLGFPGQDKGHSQYHCCCYSRCPTCYCYSSYDWMNLFFLFRICRAAHNFIVVQTMLSNTWKRCLLDCSWHTVSRTHFETTRTSGQGESGTFQAFGWTRLKYRPTVLKHGRTLPHHVQWNVGQPVAL